jgi:hypothetical protein
MPDGVKKVLYDFFVILTIHGADDTPSVEIEGGVVIGVGFQRLLRCIEVVCEGEFLKDVVNGVFVGGIDVEGVLAACAETVYHRAHAGDVMLAIGAGRIPAADAAFGANAFPAQGGANSLALAFFAY